jgi:hypothetical protein
MNKNIVIIIIIIIIIKVKKLTINFTNNKNIFKKIKANILTNKKYCDYKAKIIKIIIIEIIIIKL